MIPAGFDRVPLVLVCCLLVGGNSCFAVGAGLLPVTTVRIAPGPASSGVSISAAALSFPRVAVGARGVAQKVTLTNEGTSDLDFAEVVATGDFSQTNSCGTSVPARGSCTVTVTFTPTAPGRRSGSLVLKDKASRMRQLATLTGSAQVAAPAVSLYPTSLTLTQFIGLSITSPAITLSNTGTADLSISQISVTGAFVQTNTCGATVAVGASCTISVTFTPAAVLMVTGSVIISDNAADSPEFVRLNGVGRVPLSSPTLSASALAFPSQVERTTSAAQTLTLTNDTSQPIAIVKVKAPVNFASTNNCGTWVAFGASCTFTVTFTPTTSGLLSGSLSIQTSVSTTAQTVALSGTGYTLGPNVSLSPSLLAFAAQTVGTASVAQQVTLTNSGTSALAISKISLTGNFAQSNNCGSSVAPGASCAILVTFTPTAAGTCTGTLSVTDNATDSPESVSLKGPGQAAVAKIWLSPASLTFPTQIVGAPGPAQTVSLTNTGTVPLSAIQVMTTGDFAQVNNCPSTIAVGTGCSILITFTPTAPGARSGTLFFADSVGDVLQSVAFAGSGLATPPSVSLSPALISFPGQTLATASASQALTLTNTGGSELTITGIEISGDFAQTSNCPTSLAPGASCTLSVTFTPTVIGMRTGTVSTTGNAENSPQSASLSGNGLASTSAPGCVETGTVNFPGCFSFASPTQTASPTTQQSAGAGSLRRVRPMDAASATFQGEIAAETAQIAALLDDADPNPAQTIATLATNAMGAIEGGGTTPDPCFSPVLYYSNDPEAAAYNFAPTGQWSPGGLSLWSPTDSSGAQACAAAEMNFLLSADQARTQLALALSAETQVLAGADFPFTAGQSFDATSALAQLLASNSAQVNVTSATVTYDQGSYLYITEFTVPNSAQAAAGNIECTLILIHTPGASSASYSGIMEYGFDNGVTLLAGTTRYQRTSPTHLDISARDTVYPTRTYPLLDANNEIDPDDPNFIQSFSRFGASFDPTAALTPGSFLFAVQTDAPGVTGPGPSEGLTNTIQLLLPGDGTGGAFVGSGRSAINQPTVWQFSGTPAAGAAVGTIDHFYCAPQTGVAPLYAEFQPLQYNPASGQYVPSAAVASQIRFAPTSTCTYTDAQWNQGAAGGFWYDRTQQFAASTSQPATPAPIPQNVVADPNDPDYPLSLFGNGSAQPQTLIDAAGYTFPVLY
ncbi:MAG: choice-of-anchor D domain-containing protein [Terracidiphilus sp.]